LGFEFSLRRMSISPQFECRLVELSAAERIGAA
jgi:hypothetical protein